MVSAYINIPERFKNATFETYVPKDASQREAKEVMVGLAEGKVKNNVILRGNVGTGKTHLCYALIRNFCEEKEYTSGNFKGQKYLVSEKACIVSIKKIIDDIRTCWKKSADKYDFERIEMYKKIPILVIDEVGVQYGTDSERTELYDIINTRYEEMLQTVCCSNLEEEEIEECIGLRNWDRISGGAKIIELTGKSNRQIKEFKLD